MYNHQLDTFIAVADAGSFNKASERMYVSANALMKQINLLEKNLGFRLFERTHQGLKLTPSGESLYNDTKYMIQFSHDAILRAARKVNKQHILRIGVSFTTPVQFLVSLWSKIQLIEPALKFELISFENTPQNAREIMKNFGQKIDMVAGIYSQNLLDERNCQAFHLYDSQICCAVPINHPLAQKSVLKLDDLKDEVVMILVKHYLDDFDKIRSDMLRKKPDIDFEDIEFFNVDVFNKCVNEKKIMLAVHEWKHIHPMLKMIPLEYQYTIPFGIMFSLKPNQDMQLFINALKNMNNKL